MTNEEKLTLLLKVLKEYAEAKTCYDVYGEDYTPSADSYDIAVEYYLYKFREENDKEYNKRVKQLEKEKAEKEKAKERKLEKLKKDLASLSDADKKLLGL